MLASPLERAYRRLQLLVGIGRTQTVPDDRGPVQTVQVRLQPDNAVRDDTPVLQLYGFHSAMPVGSDVVVLFAGGDRSHGVIVGTANQAARRRGLASGEVALNALGIDLHLSAAGLVIDGAGLPITIKNAPKARFEMPIESTGEITAMADGNSVGLSTHQTTNVQPGGALSGPPRPKS